MTLLGQIHLASAFAAIVVGAIVLLVRPKGARLHRQLGWLYVLAMLTVNITALLIYRLFGGFGPFHAMAIVSLVGVLMGTVTARRARRSRETRRTDVRPGLVEAHYLWMTWAYVGLIAAFASETITRYPAFRPVLGGGRLFGVAVAAATFVIVGIGSQWIRRRKTATLAPFRAVR